MWFLREKFMNYVKKILYSLLIFIASWQTLPAMEAVSIRKQFVTYVSSLREVFAKINHKISVKTIISEYPLPIAYVGVFLLFVGGFDDGR